MYWKDSWRSRESNGLDWHGRKYREANLTDWTKVSLSSTAFRLLVKLEQIPRRHCSKMDVGKDRSHLKRHQTPELPLQKSYAPDIIGAWSLRNREQLRKRRAEAQGRQMSQWLFGEQKKRKYQRTGKGNQRGRKKQGNLEQKAEPWSQTEKETVQEVLVPAEEETVHPGNSATETLPLVASPTKAVTAEHCSEVHQESIQCQETAIQKHSQTHQQSAKAEDLSPTMCREIEVLQHSPRMCQDMAEPEVLSPKMCQETAVPQTYSPKAHEEMTGPGALFPKMCQETTVSPNHSSKVPQDMAGPGALSPKMCQETTVSPNHSSKVPQDMAGPGALSPKMCQETSVLQKHTLKMCLDVARPEVFSPEMTVPKAFPCITPGDAAGPETLPQSDVAEGCPLATTPTSVTPENTTSDPELEMAVTEGFFSKDQECTESEDLSTKTHQEAVEPEFISHETYKEFTMPIVSSHKTIQEYSPGPEDYSPETCQPIPRPENDSLETCHEMLGPEDLSIRTCKNRDGPKHSLPEGAQEVEMEEENEADQAPETLASPQGPQEACPENDIYSSALL
ncbi:hemogen isoform X2 [Mastomys coucha]|uniref:hemogen isoform X2 n=1 Tax=Mastomys coucha TaxID=35658 RepID=UPI0012617F9D|nr:hemogen isoform X2 [Mastomys coucha]